MRSPESLAGATDRGRSGRVRMGAESVQGGRGPVDEIRVRGARLHNLKNITLSIPKNRFVVLTGVSGSGKSTLGFDILHKEGQRQYLDSLGLVPYGMSKPPVDAITGLSPTVSVDQRLANRSPRSTVGTATDVYTYLRVLFARLGHRPCPSCGRDLPPAVDAAEAEADAEVGADDAAAPEETFPCPYCGAPVPEIDMAHFSFNKPEGACPTCTGLGAVHQANIDRLVDVEKSILDGAVAGWEQNLINYHSANLRAAAAYYGFEFDPSRPIKEYTQAQRDLLFFGVESPLFRQHFPGVEPPATVRGGRFEGVATSVLRRYAEHIAQHAGEADYRDKLEEFLVTQTCPDCGGTRLRPESRLVTVAGDNIVAVSALSLEALDGWLAAPRRRAQPGRDARRGAAPPAAAGAHRAVGRGRRRLPDPGPRVDHPFRGRSAAAAAGVAARLVPERAALRVRRADHRPASPRHPPPDRRPAPAARSREHRPRHRARPGHDRGCRLRARLRPGRRQARRASGGRGHARRDRCRAPLAHRRLPGRAGCHPGARPPAARRRGDRHPRRPPAQPAEHHRPAAAGDAGGGHRRFRLREVLAGVRHPRPRRPPAAVRRGRAARRARCHRGLRAFRQAHHHRPGAHRAHPTIERRDLLRRLHADPRGVRGQPGGAAPRLIRPALLVQRPRRSRGGAASAAKARAS